MKRMISHIALSTALICSFAAHAQETENISLGRNIWNRITSEWSRVSSLMTRQVNAPVKIEAPVAVAPKVEKAPNFLKRSVNGVVSIAKSTSNGLTSSVAFVGKKMSSGFTSTRTYVKAHPVKFTALVTSTLAATGALGYGIYTYIQENKKAQANS